MFLFGARSSALTLLVSMDMEIFLYHISTDNNREKKEFLVYFSNYLLMK